MSEQMVTLPVRWVPRGVDDEILGRDGYGKAVRASRAQASHRETLAFAVAFGAREAARKGEVPDG